MSMHGQLMYTGFAAAGMRCPTSLLGNGHRAGADIH